MYWLPLMLAIVAATALLIVLAASPWLPAFRRPLAFVLALVAAGSFAFWMLHEWRPSEREVARVEAALARHPCAARLLARHREYRYGVTDHAGEPNLAWIEFQLRERGAPGRSIHGLGEDAVYETEEHFADGHYERRSGRLTVMFCNADRPLTPRPVSAAPSTG